MISNKDIEIIKMCLNMVKSSMKGDTIEPVKTTKDIQETLKNLDSHIEQFRKQIFQLGDIVYWYDDDYRYFESTVNDIHLNNDGTFDYSTGDIDFTTEDIGDWVFETELFREIHLES